MVAPVFFEIVPKRRFKITIPRQQVSEKIHAEQRDAPIKQRAVALGELEPPIPFSGKHPRNLQDQSRQFRHLMILMPGKALQASNILVGDIGLIEEAM